MRNCTVERDPQLAFARVINTMMRKVEHIVFRTTQFILWNLFGLVTVDDILQKICVFLVEFFFYPFPFSFLLQ